MNREAALNLRQQLKQVTSAYEKFLHNEVINGEQAPIASEALLARELIRTTAISEVSKKRVDKILEPKTEESPVNSATAFLSSEAGIIGSATQPSVRTPRESSNFFRNLKDCIPCNKNWEWQDFDWSRLIDILNLDIEARFNWLLDIESLLNQNQIAERLCQFLRAFKDLCPQDILVLIAMFTAWLVKTIDSLEFNLEGILRDILSSILRPYISGLEDFLNIYIQFFVDQIECILNAVLVSASQLEDLSISNRLGPESLRFEKDLITGEGDRFLQDVQSVTKRASKLINEDRKEFIRDITNEWPAQLVELSRDTLQWIELQVIKTQDIVIDFLGGEWLVTSQNIGYIEQMKNVSTIIQILKAILSLGNIEELCTKDNAVFVANFVDSRISETIRIIEEVGLSSSQNGLSSENETANSASEALSQDGSTSFVNFNLDACLKTDITTKHQIDKWISELT